MYGCDRSKSTRGFPLLLLGLIEWGKVSFIQSPDAKRSIVAVLLDQVPLETMQVEDKAKLV